MIQVKVILNAEVLRIDYESGFDKKSPRMNNLKQLHIFIRSDNGV